MARIIWRTIVRGVFKAAGLDSPYSAKEYGLNWSKQRQKCLQRDDWTCQVCTVVQEEMGRELSVHHITPRRKCDSNWEQNELENLITLCSECHGKFEGQYQDCSPAEFASQAQAEL